MMMEDGRERREISVSGNQEMYLHCFASLNKAWGREKKIKNKANFKIGKIDVSYYLTSEYEEFWAFLPAQLNAGTGVLFCGEKQSQSAGHRTETRNAKSETRSYNFSLCLCNQQNPDKRLKKGYGIVCYALI